MTETQLIMRTINKTIDTISKTFDMEIDYGANFTA